MKLAPLPLAVLLALNYGTVRASDQNGPLPTVVITAKLLEHYPYRVAPTSDSADLLSNTAGYNVAASGGVSALPVVNGLADDRLKIRVDALEVTAACANHMNPPMSYVDPKQVQSIELAAGITPVSISGDNIGGTISMTTAAPVFAKPGAGLRTQGSISVTGRSSNQALSTGVSASVASDSLSLSYDGAYTRAHSYQDGHGDRVLASMFKSVNHGLTFGLRGDAYRLTLRAGVQRIPYEGFPNQYMDMTDNTGHYATLRYVGQMAWGELESALYWQNTTHEMGFFTPERRGTMPMVTEGRNLGYTVRATVPLGERQLLRAGQEYHIFRLNDYWPAVPGSVMMGPQTYVNIKDGKRDRVALFAELVTHHGTAWISQFGARGEWVNSDAGRVQAYGSNMMNAADAGAAALFNTSAHQRRDANLDLTATAQYESSATHAIEFGYARKTRSPNLYERFAWGRSTMAMTMTNWFGDGNGYVGRIDLRPEIANTVSLTAHWHGTDANGWFVKLAPYYNRVHDYIDVDALASFTPYMAKQAQGALLQFANHDTTLYGANLSWKVPIAHTAPFGELHFSGNAAFTRGSREDGGALYRIMPPTALLALEQRSGHWNSQFEMKLVGPKHRVDQRRLESRTAGYALLNLRAGYQLSTSVLLSAGVNNLFDKFYNDPLGGVYLSGLAADKGALRPLPGQGRSVDLGMSVRF
ncbi:TonB-dependent receptor [Massilia sp. CF038]|uniref:TonB-dependent receptor n=1 Tax=Massilia sp. CF038 TaxID=1881045 RepID=UPI000922861B|nr:TonB-dependent receptor [Massilia sp. CF038]SHG75679.1 iron complex outermembrane recepter protein [Massilia sp. CF038]